MNDTSSMDFEKLDTHSFQIGIIITIFTAIGTIGQAFVKDESTAWWLVVSVCSVANLGVLGTYICYRAKEGRELKLEHQRLNKQIEKLLKQLEKARDSQVECILFKNRGELYQAMHDVAMECVETSNVDDERWDASLTSFLQTNPREDTNSAVRRYHDAMEENIRKKKLMVRRIVSLPTAQKAGWIDDQVGAFKGTSNFYLRWHKKSSKISEDMVIPLNIQIYGDCHLFIIDPRTNHNTKSSTAEHRHAYFRCSRLVAMFHEYYEQLWRDCATHEVISQGVINEHVLKEISAHFNN